MMASIHRPDYDGLYSVRTTAGGRLFIPYCDWGFYVKSENKDLLSIAFITLRGTQEITVPAMWKMIPRAFTTNEDLFVIYCVIPDSYVMPPDGESICYRFMNARSEGLRDVYHSVIPKASNTVHVRVFDELWDTYETPPNNTVETAISLPAECLECELEFDLLKYGTRCPMCHTRYQINLRRY